MNITKEHHMKKNLLMTWMCVSVLTLGLAVGGSAALAKDKGEDPAGWAKGEKKGWKGAEVPPGLAKKDKKVKDASEKAEKGAVYASAEAAKKHVACL